MASPVNEDIIHEVKEIFKNYLKSNNHRQTPERFSVLEEIYRADGHFDADDMYFTMKNRGFSVSRATVYNTLDLLVECGLVQRHQFGRNQSYYERAYGFRQHDHIICENCGVVREFCDPRLQEVKDMIERVYNFKVSSHSLHFYGTCVDSNTCLRDSNSEEADTEAENASKAR